MQREEPRTLEETCRRYFPEIPVDECIRIVEAICYELDMEKLYRLPLKGDPVDDDAPF